MSTPTIKAIETRYAGCRFRSRLEARWAVAFDYLGIRWEYEPQGMEVSNRLRLDGLPETWHYLPDFWLPDYNLWAEVKGQLDLHLDLARFLSAAAHISCTSYGGCGDGGDILLLGPIPRPRRSSYLPSHLHMHKGDLLLTGWAFGRWDTDPHGQNVSTFAGDDSGNIYSGPEIVAGQHAEIDQRIADAYAAARSARFEHGERG